LTSILVPWLQPKRLQPKIAQTNETDIRRILVLSDLKLLAPHITCSTDEVLAVTW